MCSEVLAISLEGWGAMETFFLICALVGGSLFAFRLVMMFIGGGDTDFDADAGGMDFHGDMDVGGVDFHGDMDAAGGGDMHDVAGTDVHDASGTHIDDAGPDLSFRFLSFQGLTAFFAMFGLVGLAMMRQSGQDEFRSLAAALAGGVVTVWIMKFLFKKAGVLQSSGNIRMQSAVGAEGDVYLNIPADGIGKARVRVQNHLKIWDARTEDGQDIKTGERVRVSRVVDGNILVVQKIENGHEQT